MLIPLLTIGLRPWPLGSETEVVVLTQGKAPILQNGHAELTLLPDAHAKKGSFSRYVFPKGTGRVSTLTLEPNALDGLDRSTAIKIRLGNSEVHIVAVPGIAGAMHALELCQNDLLKGWGIDPKERTVASAQPKGNPGQYFTSDNYPPAALRANAEGSTVAVATIDVSGAVSECVVAASSGNDALDHATCAVLKAKAHFTPALDRQDRPMTSHMIVPVRWAIPRK